MNFNKPKYAKAKYLDASVLVKLILNTDEEEPGRKAIRSYYNNEPKGSFLITSLCFFEVLAVFKRKYLKNIITQNDYLNSAKKLIAEFHCKLDTKEKNISEFEQFNKAKKFVENYNIDLIDAMQIVTIKEGYFSHLCKGSQTLFITADKNLAFAAKEEGMKAWDCTESDNPNE